MGRGQEPTVIADRALNNAKRLTTIQYVAMLCSIVIFSLGSQIFYLIPFYMYYPALICHTPKGSFECDHHRACDVDITSYDLNWDSHDTLSNWMTQLDFICMEPFYIGILGSISFISFSIGSFFFTKQADVYGRHLVTCTAATVTPLALVILIFGVPHFGLIGIYITFAVLGLTYNPRGSTAYLYGAEMLPTNKRLLFGQVLFFADGIFSICASFYFYSVGNLNAFFAGVLVAFTTALVAMTFLLPETPSFLLMKGDIVEYQRIVALVTGQAQNGVADLDISNITEWRLNQIKKPKTSFASLWQNKRLRRNLIAVVILNSSSSFSAYFIGYYTKYFPGSFFVNYAIIGVADCFTSLHSAVLTKFFSKITNVLSFILLHSVFWCMVFIVVQEPYPVFVPFGILVIRLNMGTLANFGYHINQALFPTEYRSLASGTMNFVGRLIGATSVILVEYTTQPVMFVLVICLFVFFAINGLITEQQNKGEDPLLETETELSHKEKGLDSSLLGR